VPKPGKRIGVAIVDSDVTYRRGLSVVLERDPAVVVVAVVDHVHELETVSEAIDIALISEARILTDERPERLTCRIICMPKVKRRAAPPCELPYGDRVIARSAPLTELLIAIHQLARGW
jgi:hypothetical protein